ncbi:hypothetical protein ORD22_11870 [Sporosarcina sp. GW1-11]|uniref:hypothetical protein n=1 Tax=Sporosarcina sp. GW1-11 TaxID=2899126 RepID=UPI00294DA84A|nr:hypothetical protein [Sporosarcina sp. GW1-11]MDV6378913.1 hypothetical protein [Sporosarcina sp. GW1-11]
MTETKKPLYKRLWFIVLIVISLFSFVLGVLDSKNKRAEENRLPIEEQIANSNKYIDEATFDEDGLLTLVSTITSTTDEVSIAPTSVTWSFKTLQASFEHPEVKQTNILIKVNIIDEQENSTIKDLASILYTREEFQKLTYKEFADAVINQ